jgi:hypothetical protein
MVGSAPEENKPEGEDTPNRPISSDNRQDEPQSEPLPKLERNWPTATPKPSPVTSDARLSAGVELAHRLLWIVTASILLLLIYLSVIDIINTSNVSIVTERAMSLARPRTALENAKGLEDLISIIDSARREGGKTISVEQLSGAQPTLDELSQGHFITSGQVKRVRECTERMTLSADLRGYNSSDNLEDCLLVLTTAKESASIRSFDVDKLRLMSEFVKDSQTHHQAFRSFWLQVSQLILLNLLLPVLTALLGYIFGSQQASKSTSGITD